MAPSEVAHGRSRRVSSEAKHAALGQVLEIDDKAWHSIGITKCWEFL